MLSARQEVELGRLVRAWQDFGRHPELGKAAVDKFIIHNRMLVLRFTNRYNYSSYCRDMESIDLYHEGLLGLQRAALKYEPERGYRFSTYAVFWIRQAITRALHSQRGLIRIPVNASETLAKVKRYASIFAQEKGREPTEAEICRDLDISASVVSKLSTLNAYQQVSSIHGLEDDDSEIGTKTVLDYKNTNIYSGTQNNSSFVTDEEYQNECYSVLNKLLNKLSKEQKAAVVFRDGLFNQEALDFDKIAAKLNDLFDTDIYDKIEAKRLYSNALKRMKAIVLKEKKKV